MQETVKVKFVMRIKILMVLWLIGTLCLITACGSNNTDSIVNNPEPLCSINELETQMNQVLSEVESEVDFTFSMARTDGVAYTFNRGSSSLQTEYESASTSKLVSAVIILRLVERGYLSLSDKPQEYINNWPITSSDPLYQISLSQLLSFTSGLEVEPLCLNAGSFDYKECVYNIATRNVSNGAEPGVSFYYSGTHLQVAGLMAIEALEAESWQVIFADFQSQTGLFSSAIYDLPSSTNPRLAGGMHWVGNEYIDFLIALMNGELLNSESMALLLTDHSANVDSGYSPALETLNEDWHYGFGLWHECENPSFNCDIFSRVSSPGAYGSYPFWDQALGYVGLVARQGTLGTFKNGVLIERSVRSLAESWADCGSP